MNHEGGGEHREGGVTAPDTRQLIMSGTAITSVSKLY